MMGKKQSIIAYKLMMDGGPVLLGWLYNIRHERKRQRVVGSRCRKSFLSHALPDALAGRY